MKPKRPKAICVEPPTGPAVHAVAVSGRGPTKTRPAWYWRAVVYSDGAERTVWTGRGSPEEVRAQIWQLIGRGEHLAAPTPKGDEVVVETVRDLLQLWRGYLTASRSDLAVATRDTYTSHSRVVEEVLGDVLLEQLGRQDIERYRSIVTRPPGEDSRRRSTRSTGSLRLDLVVMDAAWKWGRSIGACPARDLDTIEVDVKRLRERYTPTAGEVAAITRQLSGWQRDLIELQWSTGARVSELLALRAADVELDRAELVVGRHERARKTGVRRVPVHPDTVPLLRRLVESAADPDARIWPQTFFGMKVEINQAILAACVAAGVPRWTTHALRRAYVIRAIRAGVDVATLATMTGHSVEELLRTYREVQDEDRRRAVALLPGRLPRGEVRQFARGGDPHNPPARSEDE